MILDQESEKARNVRLLLAKHQEQVNQLLQLRAAQEINAAMKDPGQEIPVKESSNKGKIVFQLNLETEIKQLVVKVAQSGKL